MTKFASVQQYNFKRGGDMTLYIDVLFAINFSMDFLSLFITKMILHKKIYKARILIASVIGGIYSVVEILMPLNAVIRAIINVLLSFVMCIIALKESKASRITVSLIIFWAVSSSLGGIMSIIYNFMNSILYEYISNYSYETAYNGARFFIIISLTIIISMIFTRIFSKKSQAREASVVVFLNGRKYMLSGLCDTGNLLTEPITGRAVILVSESNALSREITKMDELKKRYIPYQTIEFKGMLKGVVPKSIFVNDKEINAIIAPIKSNSFAGYDALIPGCLV